LYLLKKIYSGRTSRLQFIFLLIIGGTFLVLIADNLSSSFSSFDEDNLYFFSFLPYFFILVNRRLHDIGYGLLTSGIVGKAMLLRILFSKGDPSENKYGKPPKF
tara:strand:+ start:506 stop:817 length:312 start_codon:yes stop_codon:yes gene_type:complete